MKTAPEKKEKIIDSPDLSILKDEHVNKWVALSTDYKKLLAVGDSLSAVLEKAKSYSEKVVIKVMPNLGYAPAVV
jgi:hypothetical protein